jgi:hypothetical protein
MFQVSVIKNKGSATLQLAGEFEGEDSISEIHDAFRKGSIIDQSPCVIVKNMETFHANGSTAFLARNLAKIAVRNRKEIRLENPAEWGTATRFFPRKKV